MTAHPPVTIRRAVPDDAETIHRFVSELATYERAPEKVEATPASFRAQLESERPPFECLIAEDGDGPVGFGLYFFNYSTWMGRPGLYIEDIYVPERLRGRGIGSQLFDAMARVAGERGCGRIEFSVLDWNAPSIEFYKARGAVPLDEWTTFRLEGDALAALARTRGWRPAWRWRYNDSGGQNTVQSDGLATTKRRGSMRDELKKHGAFSWFELMTDDVGAAKDYYEKVFGWVFEKYPMGEQDYWVVKDGDDGIGGIMGKPPEAAEAPNYWATYVTVDDVDAVAKTVEAAGGQIIVPPMDIPEVGRFCTFSDPQGAVISAITYAPEEG